MSVFDELRGMVIDLPVGRILPGWVSKIAVIEAIDRLEAEHETAQPYDPDCATCQAGGHVIPPPHRMREPA